MGVVLEAIDPDLGRHVAVKVLIDRHQDRPELARRFLKEARITGGLQHPGVVPVYEVGALPDARPFFSMKLVQGRTLADLLQQRKGPADNLPYFLRIFEQVCETIAYAHSRGVIHRDLKPSNIMVGAFGEVQVMDWGLAKFLGQGEESLLGQEGQEDATTVEGLSQAGSVMGTPAFMAPEQARGDTDKVDERCDVFGLGAILCVILTGRPPFDAATTRDVHYSAAQGDLAGALARLQGPGGADDALVDLARACLALDPSSRPRDAGEVARAVTAYRESVQARLRQAELETARAQVRASEERRRRRLALALAASVVGIVVLLAGGWNWLQRQKQARQERAERLVRAVEDDLGEAARLRDQARKAPEDPALWEAALAAARRAEGRLSEGDADEALRARARGVLADLTLVLQLGQARLRPLEVRGNQLDMAGAADEYARAFQQRGLDVLGLSVEATAASARASEVREELAAALDEWAALPVAAAQRHRLRAIARQGDPDPLRKRLREALEKSDRQALPGLARSADVEHLSAIHVRLLSRGLVLVGESSLALDVLRRGQRRHPRDVWLNFELGNQLLNARPARAVEATHYYMIARALRPDAAPLSINLGNALHEVRELPQSAAAYQEAVRLAPNYALPRYSLANVLHRMGRHEEAVRTFRQAIELQPDYVEAYNNLGNVLQHLGRKKEAAAAYKKAIELRPTHARAHANLGALQADVGDLKSALVSYRRALDLDLQLLGVRNNLGVAYRRLEKLDKAIEAFRDEIALNPHDAMPYGNLGKALQRKGDLAGAIKELRQAVRLQPNQAEMYLKLGKALRAANRLDESIAVLEEAVHRDRTSYIAHNELGNAYGARGRQADALAAYREGARLRPDRPEARDNEGTTLARLDRLDEAIATYRAVIERHPRYLNARINLGLTLLEKGEHDQAIMELRGAVRSSGDSPAAAYALGDALCQAGRWGEAEAPYRESVRLRPDFPEAHNALGSTLVVLGRTEEAVPCYRRAVRLKPDYPLAWTNLARALTDLGRTEPAVLAWQQVVRLRPGDAPSWCQLGGLLERQGKLVESVGALRRGHALGVLTPGWKLPSEVWLREGERLLRGEKNLPALLSGKYAPANQEERLDLARLCLCKGHAALSAKLYKEALAVKGGEKLGPEDRFRAARAAVRAGTDKGARGLEERERAQWRKQALEWLRAELQRWAKKPPAAAALQAWQNEPDLAGVREAEALAALPEAERKEWRKFWDEVKELRRKTEGR
jgi:serine/threonine-protein kinase